MNIKPIRKIISFSTTMRNPNRIGQFLAIIERFENKILDSKVINEIIKNVLSYRLYRPTTINNNAELKELFDDNYYVFNQNELDKIIQLSPQNHKEKGFEKGWESRFDTWYKLMSEFGFCYYAKGKKILISDSGKMLVNAYYDKENNNFKDNVDESIVGAIFLNALVKYEIGNPYKKNLNHNNPLRLLIKLLNKLKANNKKYIYIKEIPILLCWQNDDVSELYKYIIELREENYKLTKKYFNYSDEFIYEKCLILLESNNRKRFKIDQIMGEATDEYIRKMRVTGLISLRGNGKYIDINSNEQEKINYIVKLDTSFPKDYLDDSEINKYEYYTYMSTIDTYLITVQKTSSSNDIKIQKLRELANKYNKEFIKNELLVTCNNKKSSNDKLLKFIDKPLRLEFLIAIFLVQIYNNLSVIPNYKSDDEGLPVFTASGGKADIIACDDNSESCIEVSLVRDRKQTILEMIPTERHLQEYIKNSSNNKIKFSIFIAPSIHSDSTKYVKFVKFKNNMDICCYAINEFIQNAENSQRLLDLNNT